MTNTQLTDPRAAYIEGLRKLANALEQHTEIPLPYEGSSAGTPISLMFFGYEADNKTAMAAAARALPCSFVKTGDNKYFQMNGTLAGLRIQLHALREEVCKRVVTATREVVEEVPDPEALAAATASVPLVKKTTTVEDVTWVCSPILATTDKAELEGAVA